MNVEPTSDQRKTRLFGPVIGMTCAGLALLVMVSLFLITRFDDASQQREQRMIEQGFVRQSEALAAVIVPQVVWDDAVARLEHRVDPAWADENIGSYLHTFNGFTRSFVIDAALRPVYASVEGKRSDPATFAPFAGPVALMVPAMREAERTRPPLRPSGRANEIIAKPVQSIAVARVGGHNFLLIATLVQPDFGKILPRGPRSPIVINAMPLDRAMLAAFGQRYLIEDMRLVEPGYRAAHLALVPLRDPSGAHIASVAWSARHPGSELLARLRLPLAAALLLFALVAYKVVQRGSAIASELIASEARAKYLAYHDPLTLLPNRSLLFERLRAATMLSRRRQRQTAIHCIDLDRFKDVNDSLGHDAGDQLIREVAKRLNGLCGTEELVARLGGDEFVIVQPCCDRTVAEQRAAAVAAALREPFVIEYGTVEIGCSIGTAMVDRDDLEPTEVLRWADLALYRSKELGRMRATFFDPEMDSAMRLRRTLEADLRSAMANRALGMVYQPQVGEDKAITAAEALVRWWHPTRGNIPPGVFVPLAEETGLILELGEYVMRRVFEETRDWDGIRVAINMSALQLRSPDLLAMVERLLRECQVDPRAYEIEVTETALLGEDDVTLANIEALKGLGFAIALDDFGTGYSSLAVLQRFAVDKIKIDRSFVANLGRADEADALVDTIVKLARALKLRVVAEGVETEAQLDRLVAAGCAEFQGHLMGYPELADELERRLALDPAPRRMLPARRG